MIDAGQQVLRGGGVTALGFAIRFGARVLFLYTAARLYGARLLGAYALALAVIEVGVLAGGLGSRWLVFQWLDRRGDRPARHLTGDAVLHVGGAAALTAVAVAAATLAIPADRIAAATCTALLVMAPAILLQALIELLLAATRWTGTLRWDVTAKNIVQPYGQIGVAIIAARAGWTPVGLPLSYLASSIAASAYAAYGAHRALAPAAGYRPHSLGRLGGSRPMLVNAAGDLSDAALARVDLYLVGVLLGEGAAGVYAIARQIAVILRQVRQSFDGLLVPLVARTLATRGITAAVKGAAAATRLVLAVQLPIVLALATIGRPLLGWFGTGFAVVYPALVILALAESLQSALGIGDLLFVYRRPWIVLATGLAGLIVVAAAGLLLIPGAGLAGAALAVLAGAVTRGVIRRRLVRHVAREPGRLAALVPLVLAALAGGVAGWACRATPPLALGAGLAAYAAVLWPALGFSIAPLLPSSLDGVSADRGAGPAPDSSSPSAAG